MSVQKVRFEDVIEIRKLNKKRFDYLQKANQLTHKKLAQKYNVSMTTIWNICNDISYKAVDEPITEQE